VASLTDRLTVVLNCAWIGLAGELKTVAAQRLTTTLKHSTILMGSERTQLGSF